MAKASKADTNTQWLDAQPAQFDAETQALLAEERQIYDMLKAHKAKITAKVREQINLPEHMEVTGTTYTRWGQWQIIVRDKPVAAPTTQRKTLADFIASAQAQGRAC